MIEPGSGGHATHDNTKLKSGGNFHDGGANQIGGDTINPNQGAVRDVDRVTAAAGGGAKTGVDIGMASTR